MGRMPIYEYRCPDCRTLKTIFFRSLAAVEDSPACPSCGNRNLRRVISRTAQVLSEDTRMDLLADSATGIDESDPKSMAQWARKMGKELGEDELGEDFDQVIDEMGAGPEADGGDPSSSDDDEG